MDALRQNSSFRILFLLNLLCNKELSKKEIIEEFKKNNIEVKQTSINNYIEKLKDSEIPVVVKKINNKNYYSVNNKQSIEIETYELDIAGDIKKLLIEQKNKDIIRKTIRVFYKFALFADNEDAVYDLVDFGYYSKINWALVEQLEKHCKNKDLIMIDYLLPNKEHKYLTIHTDEIKIGDWSNRLYLSGILGGDNKLSQLPVDKIFMIKNVIKEKVRINLKMKPLTYKVSEEMFNKIGLDEKEGLSEIKNKIATIRRPLDDTFFTLQRLLYFCPDLYYISDKKIKSLVKEKLNALKDMYDEEIKG